MVMEGSRVVLEVQNASWTFSDAWASRGLDRVGGETSEARSVRI
jgi:hypothetical protein